MLQTSFSMSPLHLEMFHHHKDPGILTQTNKYTYKWVIDFTSTSASPCILLLYYSALFLIRIFFFFFGYVGSSLLHVGCLQLWRPGANLHCGVRAFLHCGVRASHCGGFSCCRARALGARASVVVVCGLQQFRCTGSRTQAQQLWRMGLAAPRHV